MHRRTFIRKTSVAASVTLLSGLLSVDGQQAQQTTSSKPPHCPVCGDECWQIDSMKVVFDGTTPHPDVEKNPTHKSGRIFKGKLTVTMRSCKERLRAQTSRPMEITAGGYNLSENLGPGSDTSLQEGEYEVTTMTDGINAASKINGFKIRDANGRTAMEIHAPARDKGSSGCIIIPKSLFEKLENDAEKTANKQCKCNSARKGNVKLKVEYATPPGAPLIKPKK